jgi:hypothetical protein
MERPETCFICGKPDSARNLGVWFVDSECRTVHVECWVTAHEPPTIGDETAA